MSTSGTQLSARIVSLVLHPIFIPLAYGLYVYPRDGIYLRYHLLSAMFLVALPGLFTGIWLRIRKENDLFVVERANRIVPLGTVLMGSIFLAVGSGAFLPEALFPGYLVLDVFLLSFLALLVTLYWKISLHGIGWGGMTGCVLTALAMGGSAMEREAIGLGLGICLAATVAIFWARLALRSHTWIELVAGWLFGGAIMTGLTWFALSSPR